MKNTSLVSRRKLIKGLVGLPLFLSGCAAPVARFGPPPNGPGGPPPDGFGPPPDGFGPPPNGVGGPPPFGDRGVAFEGVTDLVNPKLDWATGGTASLADITYDNPFANDALGVVCQVSQRVTEGPCYSDTEVRRDISEGRDGLPVRLYFKVVDLNCQPVANAKVDIWHCDPFGIYSGDKMQMVDFCTGGKEEYQKENWFRGVQTTDKNGVVYFETCMPGWYVSRAIHIHLTITKGGNSLTTQVGFDDALVKSITTTQPLYLEHSLPDTSNAIDTVFPHKGFESFILQTKALEDDSMLAWKTLVIDA